MNCVIKCEFSGWYFTKSITPQGWYHPDIGRARIFTKRRYALKTISDAGHHVIYPGDHILKIVNVKIEEIR